MKPITPVRAECKFDLTKVARGAVLELVNPTPRHSRQFRYAHSE